MAEFSYEIKIPKERIAVLIGTDGEIKSKIEEETSTEIDIDSKEGDVFISGNEALSLFSAKEIVRAIARGFNPEIAMQLKKPDMSFEIIDLGSLLKDKQNHLLRVKGRIIGKEGKSRRLIEEMTECYISVYGKTIGVIGNYDSVVIAKKAIESLISGSPHSSVYKWLEKKRREIKKREFEEKNEDIFKEDVDI
ncbi:RNA-processing protein [Candidatus Woesearchaeota archaeon]|nr:MAG: RNA-processing protein [Candidatus Woesearchaeota archaeon]